MSELTQIEREAKLVRDFINELKGLTPRFNATKQRAEEELSIHLAKIDAERAKLRELIYGAAVIVQRLGMDEPVEVTHTEAETAAVMAEDVIAVADSPQAYDPELTDAELFAEMETEAVVTDGISIDFVADEPEAEPETFQSIGEIAAEVTAAVAAIADEAPAVPDATDEPELTDEQVERTEERLASEAPVHPDLAKGFWINRMFAKTEPA